MHRHNGPGRRSRTASAALAAINSAPPLHQLRKDDQAPQFRAVHFERTAVDVKARTVEFALSSELPYHRWWGIEVLSHEGGAVRLGRLQSGRHPLLVDHNTRDQVGVITKAWIDDQKTLRCIARFGNSARANEIFQDVQDEIRTLVSVGYQIHSLRLLKSSDDEDDTYLVDDWEPFEGSIVAVPADPTVGVGREAEEPYLRTLITNAQTKGEEMNLGIQKRNSGAPAPAPAPTPAPPAPSPAPAPATVPAQVANPEDARKQAIAAERQRSRDIAALGEKFNQREAAAKAVEDGTSYDAFREAVFNGMAESGQIRLAEPGTIGLTNREAQNFRFSNLILATMYPNERGMQELAAFELECSRAAQEKRDDKRADRQHGFCIPVDVLSRALDINSVEGAAAMRMIMGRGQRGGVAGQQRDLVVGTPTAGGNLVATELLASSFIDLLVNEMVMMRMGATMLTDLQGNIAIPRATGGSTGYWVAESGSPTESQPAFDQVALTPKTVGAFVDYSRRLLMQSSIAVEAFVRMDIARTIALNIDAAALKGPGTGNQPTGILNTSGIGSVAGGTNGAVPSWGNIVDLESAVANSNAPNGSRAYLTNTRVRGKLKQTQKFTGTNGQEIWTGAGELNGSPGYVSNQVPSNLTKGTSAGVCSAIVYGNWSDLIIALWGGLDMMLDPYAGATSGTKRVIALQDVDVNVRYPVSFAAMLDALTT